MKKIYIVLVLGSFLSVLSCTNHQRNSDKKLSNNLNDTLRYVVVQDAPLTISVYVFKKQKTDTILMSIPDSKLYGLSGYSSFQLNGKGSKELIIDYYAETWGHSDINKDDSIISSNSWGSHFECKEIWDIDSCKQLFQCVYENSSQASIHEIVGNPPENRDDSSFYSYDVKLEPNKIILCNYKGYTKPDWEMGTYVLKNNQMLLQKKLKRKQPK